MKKKERGKPEKQAIRRRNISLNPEVNAMLEKLAAAEYTKASSLLTTMILERYKDHEDREFNRKGITPLPSLVGESSAAAS